jgi:hypothetical protein
VAVWFGGSRRRQRVTSKLPVERCSHLRTDLLFAVRFSNKSERDLGMVTVNAGYKYYEDFFLPQKF